MPEEADLEKQDETMIPDDQVAATKQELQERLKRLRSGGTAAAAAEEKKKTASKKKDKPAPPHDSHSVPKDDDAAASSGAKNNNKGAKDPLETERQLRALLLKKFNRNDQEKS